MKPKAIFICSCMTTAIMLISYHHAQAQSTTPIKPSGITDREVATDLTYKIFQAPNSMYGYDIFKNNKFIFHQPASPATRDNSISALSKKDQADKAALFAIEKIKKGQSAELSQPEIKKIISQ